MSVGHVALAAERAGIPTVTILVRAFRHVAERMGLPRTVVTRHPMGRPLGPAGDPDTHRAVVETALALLESAPAGGAMVEMDRPFRPPTA